MGLLLAKTWNVENWNVKVQHFELRAVNQTSIVFVDQRKIVLVRVFHHFLPEVGVIPHQADKLVDTE